MEEKRNTKRKNKKEIKFPPFLKKIIMVATAVIVLAAVAVFALFRVRTFKVTGTFPYTVDEIVTSSGVAYGKSILTVDTDLMAENLETALPYMDNVTVKKRIPGTLVIDGKTSEEVYSVMLSKGIYALTNEDTKILSVSDEITDGTIAVESSLKSMNYTIGTKVSFTEQSEKIQGLLSDVSYAITESGLQGVEVINITDESDIYLIYQDRMIIKIGDDSEAARKLTLAAKSIEEENKLSTSQYGVMDVSEVKKAVFAPKDYKDMTELVEYIEAKELAAQEAEEAAEKEEESSSDESSEAGTGEETAEETTLAVAESETTAQ